MKTSPNKSRAEKVVIVRGFDNEGRSSKGARGPGK